MNKIFIKTIIIALLLTNLSANKVNQKYLIATANSGGTFYPVGVGIATIASLELSKKNRLIFSAITSAGSAENIDMLEKGEVNFALLQGLFASMAWQGKATYENKAKKNLRSISMLWQNVEQFTVKRDFVNTGNIMDLKNLYGKKFSISGRNSGSRISAETIMNSLGINFDKMDVQYLGYTPSSIALQNGKIQGMNTPSGPPTPAVTNVFTNIGANNIKVLEFNEKNLKDINNNYPVWNSYIIKAGTYVNQLNDIHTIAQPNLLVVTKETPMQTVYLLTKAIYENLPFLNTVHKATKVMSLQKAIVGLPMPLHPGALKFYKEKGIKIPSSLIPKEF